MHDNGVIRGGESGHGVKGFESSLVHKQMYPVWSTKGESDGLDRLGVGTIGISPYTWVFISKQNFIGAAQQLLWPEIGSSLCASSPRVSRFCAILIS